MCALYICYLLLRLNANDKYFQNVYLDLEYCIKLINIEWFSSIAQWCKHLPGRLLISYQYLLVRTEGWGGVGWGGGGGG